MIERLESILAQGKDDAMLRFGLGSALFNEKRYAEAAEHLERCVGHDETYSAAYKLLGRSLMNLGDDEKARAVFDRGLSVAKEQGDRQSEKEMTVFLKKLDK